MILELATITIKAGTNADFEANLEKAQGVISKADGYISHEFQQGVENPSKYVFLIKWESLEAHTFGFRQSQLFLDWRALIGPFFENPPHVEHFELNLKS